MDKQQRGIQVIRIWLGVTMLIHGVMKVTSLEDTLAFFASIGLPSLFFIYGVAAIELIGGLFMIIGFFNSFGISRIHSSFSRSLFFSFGLASGFSGYEYELFLAITSLAILVSYADKKYLTLKLYF